MFPNEIWSEFGNGFNQIHADGSKSAVDANLIQD